MASETSLILVLEENEGDTVKKTPTDNGSELNNESILEIVGLKTYFFTQQGTAKAVDDVSIIVRKGETLGVVGESGCGKSVTALSVIRLVPDPPGKIVSGEIKLAGRGELTKLHEADMLDVRGNEISMIFQEPMTSLNPVFTIGNQISEAMQFHKKMSKKEARDRSIELLQMVGIHSPGRRLKDYPHQLSGGMRQRVMIAMALSCNPKLLLADEPTTALDVTIQAQILDLMNKLKSEVGTAIMLITHNLGVVAEVAQRVCVMYAGVVVETADVKELFASPLHPYTSRLLTSIPRLDLETKKDDRLDTIPGVVPSLLDLPPGCRFSNRCNKVQTVCREREPPLICVSDGSNGAHLVRCWLHCSPATQ
jgi:peptide/nickel transport system ATP-binding protein/oligopeptide transport system ATP-binding protein